MFNLFKHELRSRWRMIFLWGIGLTLFASIYISVYPEIQAQIGDFAAFMDMPIMEAFGMDMFTMEGFIASVVVQFIPIVLGIYVIMLATGTLAGEEEDGTLEMVVAMPLKRWQVVTMKTAALMILLLLIIMVFATGSSLVVYIVANNADLTLDLEPIQLFMALLATYPLMIALFGIGLFTGALFPSRRWALIVMFTIYIASYAANSLAAVVDAVSWMSKLSMFSYINTTSSVFTEGPDPVDTSILLGIGVLFFILTLWSFQIRNLTVGQWAWQKGKATI